MSITSLVTTVAPALSESAHSEAAISPWLIGAGAFAVLVALLVGLLMFGAGREHS